MTREELCSIPLTESKIRILDERIKALRVAATSLSAPLSPDKVQSSGAGDRIARIVANIVDVEAEMKETQIRLAELKVEANRLVDELPEPEQSVMALRYCCGYTWARVADETGYDERYVYKIGARALSILFPDRHC